MKLTRRGVIGLGAVALAVAAGGTAFAATSAPAAPTVTAVTHVINDADSGNLTAPSTASWATDDFDRTLTVTLATSGTVTDTYTATVSDTGIFVTNKGADTPNQSVPGQVIANSVKGTFSGSAQYTITAPATDSLSDVVPAALNDNFTHPSGGPTSTADWPQQAFVVTATGKPDTSGAVVVDETSYSYTYTTAAGETWTDGSATGDGDVVADGNITGLLAPPKVIIRLSHGHGTATAPTRETVSYQQSGAASWDEFYIVGPGPINGHKGWVNGKVGLNFGYYEGLEANHGYTVYYTPVEGQGSNVQVPDAHPGDVYFVS
jgi:hypothetical protein